MTKIEYIMSKFLDYSGLQRLWTTINQVFLLKGTGEAHINDSTIHVTSSDKTTWNNKVSNVQSDWSASSGLAQILNKPTLATVATSGSYNDLSNKPTIPIVPTNVSAFTNDAGYLTAHQDISGKANDSEVLHNTGNETIGGTKTFMTSARLVIEDSWSQIYNEDDDETLQAALNARNNVQADWNQTTTTAADYIKNKPTIPTVPTNVSAFNNDAGYLTSHQSLTNYVQKSNTTGLLKNDGTVDTNTYLTQHQSLSGYATEQWVGQQGYLTQHQDISGKLDTTATAKKAAAIPWGQLDSTSTATVMTATVPGITALEDGVAVMLKNGVVTSGTNFTLNINNLGAKSVYTNLAAATKESSKFNINYTMLFVYDSTRVSGGGWVLYNGYDSNTNTIGYQLRTNNTAKPMANGCRYYKILFTSADGTKWVPSSATKTNDAAAAKAVNQTPINPFGPIVYCANNTNYNDGTSVAASAIWQQYNVTIGHAFNWTGAALTLTSGSPVYVKCAPQSNGSAIMDSTTPLVQTLPSTEDGKIYIFLGVASAATTVELWMTHPVYYYKDSAIRLWTNQVAGGDTAITNGEIDTIWNIVMS